ncbi:hypothetical protein PTKIN_Ptkin04bG0228300 [Pterospermum kingtungense]
MSLNCLTCQVLQRTNSNSSNESGHCGKEKGCRRFCCIRSWSGNLSPATYEQIRSDKPMSMAVSKKIKKGHHRRLNTIDTTYRTVAFVADGEPRLVRSSGMRRDWSFENLREKRVKR